MGEVSIKACDGVDFEIEEGEFAIIVGPSGAGKTTVLNIDVYKRQRSGHSRHRASGRNTVFRVRMLHDGRRDD